MDSVLITPPAHPLQGRAVPPGSKSITNRVLLLAALAGDGPSPPPSRIYGALKSDDTARMSQALRAMGVAIEEPDDTTFIIAGRGRLARPAQPLQLGNAGTAMRFLTAAAALVEGEVTLDGDAQMRRRPIAPLVAALGRLGVILEAPTGCPPVTVHGRGGVTGDRVEIDAGLSSQYISALLMMAGAGRKAIDVALLGSQIGARGYVDLTLAAMRTFGADVQDVQDGVWRILPTGYRPTDVTVEPDASAATYLWAAERLTGGRIDLGAPAYGLTQPDAKAYELIGRFPNLPEMIDGSQIQDAVPTLAVLAALNQTPVRFVGVANLRVKECDRIFALVTELCRLRPGLAWAEGDDFVVHGDPSLAGGIRPVLIQTYHDHRIAMSFALLGLRLSGIRILDPGCVAKTWPGYWDVLTGLGVSLTFQSLT